MIGRSPLHSCWINQEHSRQTEVLRCQQNRRQHVLLHVQYMLCCSRVQGLAGIVPSLCACPLNKNASAGEWQAKGAAPRHHARGAMQSCMGHSRCRPPALPLCSRPGCDTHASYGFPGCMFRCTCQQVR